ncbi:MAG: hypothetical protein O3B31_06445 [Chloroflexi bacterium]|nr:hypothetical protein [Chloroflexota bacterium]MDA1002974.1 hypothetical protein [Chloroflexota bacterium]
MQEALVLSQALMEFGDEPELREIYARLNAHPTHRFGMASGSVDSVRGALALRLGDVDAAQRRFDEGLAWAARPDVRCGLVKRRCHQSLADVAERRGEHVRAMEHLDAAATRFSEYGAKLYIARYSRRKRA